MQRVPIKRIDGKYCWSYEMSLFKNPNTFLLVAKVLLGSVLGVGVVILLPINLISNGLAEGFRGWLVTMGIMTGIFAVLLIAGYLLYAAIMGGSYDVDFLMDEKGFVHAQSFAQAKKAEKLGAATAAAGALAGRRTAAGIGLTSQRTTSTTEFQRVTKVVTIKRRSVIKVRGGGWNELYADGADFDFAAEWIRARIPADALWVEK